MNETCSWQWKQACACLPGCPSVPTPTAAHERGKAIEIEKEREKGEINRKMNGEQRGTIPSRLRRKREKLKTRRGPAWPGCPGARKGRGADCQLP